MPKPLRDRSRQQSTAAANPPAELAPPTASPGLPTAKGNITMSGTRAPGTSQRRPTYPEAVARYEEGMRALQEHRFEEAAAAFRSVLTQYPEEKELNDRVRLYLSICERHLNATPEPRTVEERLYAATIALNAGDADTALRHLGAIVAQDPEHDGALYMLGVVHALKDDTQTALSYLQRAIEKNPENRALALQDGDLERLLQDESARAAVEAAAGRSAIPRPRPMR